MKKAFGIIALALALAACNKNEFDIHSDEQPSEKAERITITATLAPKAAGTKAVSVGTGTIISTWETGEHLAILYEVSESKYAADAEIIAVDGSGSATISFTVEAGTADNTDCQIVYPLSAAKDDHTGVKNAATLLAAQDGTLGAKLDVRVGAGKIQISTPGLTVTTQPAAQFAIFKFTVKNAAGDAIIDVKPLTVTIGAQNYVITPGSATSVLYAALPAVSSQTVSFSATGSDSKTYSCSKGGVTFSAGYYYQSALKMTPHCTYAAPTKRTGLTFNGNSSNVAGSPQNLVNAGSASNATIYYSTDGGSSWSASIPSATNAGSYTVHYKVVPDAGYTGGRESTSLGSVSIAKANGWCELSSSSSNGWGTVGKKVSFTVNHHGGGLSYSLSGDTRDTANMDVSISGNTVSVKLISGQAIGKSSVTVRITSAATTNYKEAKATYTCYKD
ncbi:MAG: hypothetical protein IJU68_01540 [Bacteroidales bacterium]|nr:hypothetical protein [Bacteroidales bacterium]